MDKNKAYVAYVNNIWRLSLNAYNSSDNPNHLFLQDMERARKQIYEDQNKARLQEPGSSDYNLNSYFTKGKCNWVPSKVLSSKLVDQLWETLIGSGFTTNAAPLHWPHIKQGLDVMNEHLLYSTLAPDALTRFYQSKPDRNQC